MIIAAIVITLLYVLTMLFLLFGFSKVRDHSQKNLLPTTTFSIVIPFRNEAENLPVLLKSLLQLKYSHEFFEILLINDASEDASENLCEEFLRKNPQLNIKLLQNIRRNGSPKKDAILTAIKVSKMEYIITTDADCIVPENWLQEFDAKIQTSGVKVVAGPVSFKTEVSKMTFLDRFQELDLLSLQAATIGGFGVDRPFMCNGANFCYSKNAFLKVKGFEGNKNIASGDDIFLLEKFREKALKMTFLRSQDAIVTTNPAQNLQSLISQRVRWAAKASAYRDFFGKGIGVLVFLMNFLIFVACIGAIFGFSTHYALLVMFLFKFNVDFLLIYNSAKFFSRESSLKSYFWSSLIYPFFSSYIAITALFSGYKWKGRRFKK